MTVIGNILRAGNRLLIVSKPHLECIEAICRELKTYRDAILFRFTIGAIDDAIFSYWEPGAAEVRRAAGLARTRLPPRIPHERELRAACWKAKTSACCSTPWRLIVTDTIWIGKMNGIEHRVEPDTDPLAIRPCRKDRPTNGCGKSTRR